MYGQIVALKNQPAMSPAQILSYIHNGGPYSNEMTSYVGAKEYFVLQQSFFIGSMVRCLLLHLGEEDHRYAGNEKEEPP